MKFSFFALLLATQITAAGQIQLTGKITTRSQQPVPYANILLLASNDSTIVQGSSADIDGFFTLQEVKAGNYTLSIRSIGFETKSFAIDVSKNLNFGTIILEEVSTTLKEVVIKAEKPFIEQHVDRMVVNVENSVVSSGSTILDVLERSPGISVNRQSGTLSMNGKQGVQVLINGKLQRLPLTMVIQQLEGVTSASVEKIELIQNPSAKFDAEGGAGIINIITKTSKEFGTNGTATIGMGFSDYSGYLKPTGAFILNHKRHNFTTFLNYSINHDRRWQQWNYERQVLSTDLYSNTTTDRHVSWPIQRASLGASWSVTKRTSISGMVSAFSDLWKMDSFNESRIAKNGIDSAYIRLFDREVNHWKHLMGNFNITHTFKNESKLLVDVDYLYYHDHNPNVFVNDYTFYESNTELQEHVRTGKETPINMGVLKIDYERQFKGVKIETGMKTTFSRLKNKVKLENKIGEAWIADPKFTQNYVLRDDVNAVYVNSSGKIGVNGQFQFGLRAEGTDMEMKTAEKTLFKLAFWKLFPTAFYTWKVNENKSIQFSYGKRITRPAYTSVAPFIIFMDPFTYYWGNLQLKPAISNSFQATFLQEDFQLTLKYSHDKNAIAGNQSHYNAEDQKTYIYADNVDLLQLYSASATLPVEIKSWWKSQNSALVTYQRTDHVYNETPISFNQFSTRVSTFQTFSLPANFTFEITGIYVAPRRIGLSLLKSVTEVSAGLQKKINERGRLSLTITDIFWTRNSIYVSENPASGQIQKTSYYNEPRVLRLSYSVTFGNSQLKIGKQRSTASEAEQQRVN